jgi:hypothetical protein
MNSPTFKTKIIWLILFSIAMGYLETAVVVYIRKIVYPEGFQFPLTPINAGLAVTEFWREVATIIMLLGIGIITGKNKAQKFSYFIFCFGIWDIFYYVFLKVLLNWPESFFTWDILFLIPVPWVGPVLAPCIVSATMIYFAYIVAKRSENDLRTFINKKEWWLMIIGSLVLIFSFTTDYFSYVLEQHTASEFWTVGSKKSLFNEIASYIPRYYNWWIFAIGEGLIVAAIISFVKRYSTYTLTFFQLPFLKK